MTGRLWTDEQVLAIVRATYEAGQLVERARVANGHAALSTSWKALGYAGYARTVQARLEEMAAYAGASGHEPWTGVGHLDKAERMTVYRRLLATWDT